MNKTSKKCMLCTHVPESLMRSFKAKVAEKGLRINAVHIAMISHFIDDNLPAAYISEHMKKKT